MELFFINVCIFVYKVNSVLGFFFVKWMKIYLYVRFVVNGRKLKDIN